MTEQLIKTILTVCLIPVAGAVIRLIVVVTELQEKLKDLSGEINSLSNSANNRIDGVSHRQNYLWEKVEDLEQSVKVTDTMLNNHSGLEGHPGAMASTRELHDRFERLKALVLLINYQMPAPVDPNKVTLS